MDNSIESVVLVDLLYRVSFFFARSATQSEFQRSGVFRHLYRISGVICFGVSGVFIPRDCVKGGVEVTWTSWLLFDCGGLSAEVATSLSGSIASSSILP